MIESHEIVHLGSVFGRHRLGIVGGVWDGANVAALRDGHHHEVRVNDSTNNLRIDEVIRAIDRAKALRVIPNYSVRES